MAFALISVLCPCHSAACHSSLEGAWLCCPPPPNRPPFHFLLQSQSLPHLFFPLNSFFSSPLSPSTGHHSTPPPLFFSFFSCPLVLSLSLTHVFSLLSSSPLPLSIWGVCVPAPWCIQQMTGYRSGDAVFLTLHPYAAVETQAYPYRPASGTNPGVPSYPHRPPSGRWGVNTLSLVLDQNYSERFCSDCQLSVQTGPR